MMQLKEYTCVKKCDDVDDTIRKLNDFARTGWKVICSYCSGDWIILERDIKLKGGK